MVGFFEHGCSGIDHGSPGPEPIIVELLVSSILTILWVPIVYVFVGRSLVVDS